MTDNKQKLAMLAQVAGAAAGHSARMARALGGKLKTASTETKAATAGGATLCGVGAVAGSHIGIAALGTAVSGLVVLAPAGVIVGALVGYSGVKLMKDWRAQPKAPVVVEPDESATKGS